LLEDADGFLKPNKPRMLDEHLRSGCPHMHPTASTGC
jgi:hypothetical protein